MSTLSHFFDNQNTRTNPFGANQSADRGYRRAERIAAALYLITNHISSAEPLRVSIRTRALKVLEDILSLRNEMRAVDSAHLISCLVSIRHLISMVRMLTTAGLVSTQNASIVMDGLDELGNFLSVSKHSPLSESISFSRDDLLNVGATQVKDIKDSLSPKDKAPVKDSSAMSHNMSLKGGLSVREQGIMGVLRAGGELGIKDIVSNLPEYSEKMIQRDLAELVSKERVKKTGLKRWSRYSTI